MEGSYNTYLGSWDRPGDLYMAMVGPFQSPSALEHASPASFFASDLPTNSLLYNTCLQDPQSVTIPTSLREPVPHHPRHIYPGAIQQHPPNHEDVTGRPAGSAFRCPVASSSPPVLTASIERLGSPRRIDVNGAKEKPSCRRGKKKDRYVSRQSVGLHN